MSRHGSKANPRADSNILEIKSKHLIGRVNKDSFVIQFDAEFRRFSLDRTDCIKYDEFCKLVQQFHHLQDIPFTLFYTDPIHGDLLPINNDENFARAANSSRPLLRLFVQKKGNSWEDTLNGSAYSLPGGRKKNIFALLPGTPSSKSRPAIQISGPEDFRQVSSIIDVDVVPDTCRRVRLVKHGSDKPLGFYIRDGTSVRVTPHGLEKVPGIFISRLVPGGLAESTGLLAVNDEVLEVNGIEVAGKSLDQVTDMMVANSSNLIITIRPANQCGGSSVSGTLATRRGSFGHSSQMSHSSHVSQHSSSQHSTGDDDDDEIRDHTHFLDDNNKSALPPVITL